PGQRRDVHRRRSPHPPVRKADVTSASVSTHRVLAPPAEQNLRAPRTLWSDAARRFRRNKLALGALVVMLLLIFAAVFANVISPYPYDYSVLTQANKFPSW